MKTRARKWLVGMLLVLTGSAWQAAPARAAIWPFTLFMPKKTIVKRTKTRPGKPAYGNRIKATKPVH